MDGNRGVCALLALSVLGLGLLAVPPRASAEPIGPTPHVLDPVEQELDHTQPGMVQVLEVRVKRGQGPERDGCGWEATSLDGTGTLSIRLAAPADDRTPSERMGYRLALASGFAPEGLLPAFDMGAWAREDGTWLYLSWNDGDTDDQEPLDFELTVRAVDLGGNAGEASSPLAVQDPGGGGCATGGAAWTPPAALLALLLGLRHRRRRAR